MAMGELAVVGLLFVADVYRLIPLSKIPFLLALGWISLWLRGLRWTDVGWLRDRAWGKTLLAGTLWGVAFEVFELFVSQPLIMRLTGKAPDLSDFQQIRGNVQVLLIFLVLVWVIAALGEELVYRGYLMNRVAGLMRGTRNAWAVSLIAVSMVFGAGHIDQGITGQLENALDGLLLGGLYLNSRRSLAVPIVAHGVWDTIDLILLFAGTYPGIG